MFERLTARFTEMDIDLVKRGADPFRELVFTLADRGALHFRVADLPSRCLFFCVNRSLDRLRPLFSVGILSVRLPICPGGSVSYPATTRQFRHNIVAFSRSFLPFGFEITNHKCLVSKPLY